MSEVAANIKTIGDQLAALSLKDAVELGKYLKDTYGIEAAAGGGVMMAAAPAAAAAAAPVKDSFDVVLKAAGEKKLFGIVKVEDETAVEESKAADASATDASATDATAVAPVTVDKDTQNTLFNGPADLALERKLRQAAAAAPAAAPANE
jgi:large subunit ribosomal protein L7/L12